MITFVTRMLDLNKKIVSARLPQEKELIQRQIDATNTAIDNLVYNPYGLTEEERNIVEDGVK